MRHFLKENDDLDLSHPLVKIRDLSSKIEQRLAQKDNGSKDGFIETLSVEELKDLRQVILASEYLLTKYQDRQYIKSFLEDFIGIIMNAANSVNSMKGELENLVISAEVALRQIQELHHEVTEDLALGKVMQTKMDDFRDSFTHKPAVGTEHEVSQPDHSSPINLTNTARPFHTNDYLGKTAVEI